MALPLTVAIPTYNRPDWLARAISSVTSSAPWVARETELVVSDNSQDERSKEIAQRLTQDWSGSYRYSQNPPGTGMVGNFNKCVELASGRQVLILHDDDYLLPRGLERIHRAIAATEQTVPLLFGVRVVDQHGRVRRRQQTRRDRIVPPEEMLERFLTHSSLVRFPAMVVPRAAYANVGPFDDSLGGVTDLDMWSRLFARYGARRVATTIAAYVVHPAAATESTWTPDAVREILAIFERRSAEGVLDDATLRRCRKTWMHQFLLAGAIRRLRVRDRGGAAEIMSLFDLPELSGLGWSPRWAPLRLGLMAVTRG